MSIIEQRNTWTNQNILTSVEASLTVRADDSIQMMSDRAIEDSPFQVRRDVEVADLVEAMRSVGFQGVLIARQHPDLAKRQRGVVQLVYGHRRRAAWRILCAQREEQCVVPVIVRDYSDDQMLLIGVQENLQRTDLNVVEEAEIVRLFQRRYFNKNLSEIAALLTRSESWVRERSRIAGMPDALKERLRQKSNVVRHFLMLAPLYEMQPDLALQLADLVTQDEVTVNALHQMIAERLAPVTGAPTFARVSSRDIAGNSTSKGSLPADPVRAEIHKEGAQALNCENTHNINNNAPVSNDPDPQSDRRPLDVMCEMINDIEQILSDAVLEANDGNWCSGACKA
jgi:ParB family chromosome partitioning protein